MAEFNHDVLLLCFLKLLCSENLDFNLATLPKSSTLRKFNGSKGISTLSQKQITFSQKADKKTTKMEPTLGENFIRLLHKNPFTERLRVLLKSFSRDQTVATWTISRMFKKQGFHRPAIARGLNLKAKVKRSQMCRKVSTYLDSSQLESSFVLRQNAIQAPKLRTRWNPICGKVTPPPLCTLKQIKKCFTSCCKCNFLQRQHVTMFFGEKELGSSSWSLLFLKASISLSSSKLTISLWLWNSMRQFGHRNTPRKRKRTRKKISSAFPK